MSFCGTKCSDLLLVSLQLCSEVVELLAQQFSYSDTEYGTLVANGTSLIRSAMTLYTA